MRSASFTRICARTLRPLPERPCRPPLLFVCMRFSFVLFFPRGGTGFSDSVCSGRPTCRAHSAWRTKFGVDRDARPTRPNRPGRKAASRASHRPGLGLYSLVASLLPPPQPSDVAEYEYGTSHLGRAHRATSWCSLSCSRRRLHNPLAAVF